MKKSSIYTNSKDVVMSVKPKFKKNSECMYLNVNIPVSPNDFRETSHNAKSRWLTISFLGLFYFKILFIEYLFPKPSHRHLIYPMDVLIT